VYGIHSLVNDFVQAVGDISADLVASAIKLSLPVLQQDPKQLRGQLIGRLSGLRFLPPEVEHLLVDARAHGSREWLCPVVGSLESPLPPQRPQV